MISLIGLDCDFKGINHVVHINYLGYVLLHLFQCSLTTLVHCSVTHNRARCEAILNVVFAYSRKQKAIVACVSDYTLRYLLKCNEALFQRSAWQQLEGSPDCTNESVRLIRGLSILNGLDCGENAEI